MIARRQMNGRFLAACGLLLGVLCLTLRGAPAQKVEAPNPGIYRVHDLVAKGDGKALDTVATHAATGVSRGQWPQFRGRHASGIADTPEVPLEWDRKSGKNIKWRTELPGLGLSSPVVWGDKVYLTTAVGEGREDEAPSLRVGLYGDIAPVSEDYAHFFQVCCLDTRNGKILWRKTAHKGVPQVKRHTKSSHASSSVATDGRHVVAFFGSEGLFCYDPEGKLIWSKQLGYLNSAFFAVPQAQWGFGSSPVIFKNRVIVQCDVMEKSFVAAFNVETGKEIWRTSRKDVPTWCTPTVANVQGKAQVLVNGWHHRGAYDFETGKEIWRMDGGGDIPIPTPIVAQGMAFFSSAHGGLAPIYAIRLEAQGDISLGEGKTTNDHVVWSTPRQGTYMPTPIALGDYLYVGGTSGFLGCYDVKTGKELYRERIGGQRDAYTASPVAAGGKLFFVSESGTTHIIEAGPEYKHIGSNELDEPVLASPAIAGKRLFLRSSKALYAIEEASQR